MDLLQTNEVLERLNVSRQTITRWEATGRLVPRVRGTHASPHLFDPEDVARVARERAFARRYDPRDEKAAAWLRRALSVLAPEVPTGEVQKFLALSPAPGK